MLPSLPQNEAVDELGPHPEARPLRSDAVGNRLRVLEAARQTFAEFGLDAPISAVARRAGVGVATVYRRFPTREDLVVEVFCDRVRACTAIVLAAAEDPDPWRGFSTAIGSLCTMDAEHRGLARAFLTAYPGRVDFAQERTQAEHAFAQLVRRAQGAGRLRLDFDRSDLDLLLAANGALTHRDPAVRRAQSRRLAELMLTAFSH